MANDIWITILLFLLPTVAAGWLYREWSRLRVRLKRLSRTAQSKHQYFQEVESHHQDEADLKRRTEAKLRRYLRLMDTVINTIPNPIFFQDVDGIFQGCNQAFARNIVGLTRDRINGRKITDLERDVPGELIDCLQRPGVRQAAFEAEILCADGRRRDFLFSTASVDGEAREKAGRVVMMQDLTEKNRAARDRAQKEKFQGVLETAGAVCHELNQPLQVISGYVELMMMEGMEGPKQQELAGQVLEQVERIADITGKLQKITRYKTVDYGRHARIIDIHQSSEED